MSRRIAILGASGSVGNAVAVHILRSKVLAPADRLLLVGHGVAKTERKLLSTRIDLLDAFDDERVDVEIVPDVSDVDADIVIVAAGATISAQCSTRRDLGEANRSVFEHVADECASRLPDALFIVVSNPVELAVEILSFATDRKRIIGMGAQQDSLRFARAIATDLGLSRHEVRATVMGEHGQAMLPLWRSVELLVDSSDAAEELAFLMRRASATPLEERVAMLKAQVAEFVSQELVAEAYQLSRTALPDARIFVEPFITAHAMHSTPNATANATLECLAATLTGDGGRIHGQVRLKNDVLMLEGVCGIPLHMGPDGWRAAPLDWLTAEEVSRVRESADSIERFVSGILASAAKAPSEALLIA